MATTVNTGAPKWTASQNQPDVTINSALDVLDACMGPLVIDFQTDADYTLDNTGAMPREWQHLVIEMTDTGVVLTGATNVILPITKKKMWFCFNNTAQILTFKNATGTGIAVGVGMRAILQNDGTNVVRWTADI